MSDIKRVTPRFEEKNILNQEHSSRQDKAEDFVARAVRYLQFPHSSQNNF